MLNKAPSIESDLLVQEFRPQSSSSSTSMLSEPITDPPLVARKSPSDNGEGSFSGSEAGSTAYTQNLDFFLPAICSIATSVGFNAAAPDVFTLIPFATLVLSTTGGSVDCALVWLSSVRARFRAGSSYVMTSDPASRDDRRSPCHSPESDDPSRLPLALRAERLVTFDVLLRPRLDP